MKGKYTGLPVRRTTCQMCRFTIVFAHWDYHTDGTKTKAKAPRWHHYCFELQRKERARRTLERLERRNGKTH